MKTINVTIKGTLPLLQHRMDLNALSAPGGPKAKTKTDNPEHYLYKDGDGNICQPSEHIYQAIIKRLSNFQIVGKGKKTYKELGTGCIRVSPEYIPHKITDWVPFAAPVKVGNGRVTRIRPRFNEWELAFQVHIINEDMPTWVIKQCLDIAGAEGGLGDYRPRFGLFMVTEFIEN